MCISAVDQRLNHVHFGSRSATIRSRNRVIQNQLGVYTDTLLPVLLSLGCLRRHPTDFDAIFKSCSEFVFVVDRSSVCNLICGCSRCRIIQLSWLKNLFCGCFTLPYYSVVMVYMHTIVRHVSILMLSSIHHIPKYFENTAPWHPTFVSIQRCMYTPILPNICR